MLFGEPFLMKREVCWSCFICLDVFGVGWLSSSSALTVVWCVCGLPSGATGFGGVSRVPLDTPRCVSCISRKHRQVSWHCVVFSGWRVMYVCGVGAVSLRSCFSAAGDSCVPLPLLTGLSRSVGCAFLQNCTYRGTLGALGPWTAPRISHSPSSCRACHFRQHGYMGLCGVSQVALGLT